MKMGATNYYEVKNVKGWELMGMTWKLVALIVLIGVALKGCCELAY
jgi:hypothetical protein